MRVILLMLLSGSLSAESVWTDDGSLVITDTSTEVYIEDGSVKYDVEISSSEPTFVYGEDKLTVCMPTANGSICY
jgi:hypothetical protein